MVQPTGWPLALFLGVVAFAAVLPVLGVVVASAPPDRRRRGLVAAAVLAAWMLASTGFAWSGVAHGPAPFPFLAGLLVINLIGAVGMGLSRWGGALVALPIGWLVGFHAFRLPLEVVLHAWASRGTVPTAMSWSGENFDVLTGLAALVVAPLARRWPVLVWAFEALGVAMLVNIVRIVVRSTPGSPFYTGVEPPVLLAAYWPTVWIATVCVFFAVAGHVVVGRWLVKGRTG